MHRTCREKFCIQEHLLLIIMRHPLFKVWMAGQSICLVISSRFMYDNELEM